MIALQVAERRQHTTDRPHLRRSVTHWMVLFRAVEAADPPVATMRPERMTQAALFWIEQPAARRMERCMTLHVLIIDADPSAAQVTCATIKHLVPDTVCSVADNPVQGWLRLRQQPADLLIIDPARYPQVGQRLLELVGDTLPQVQVAVLSSTTTPATSRLPGVGTYLDKALSPGMLRIKLRALLQAVASSRGATRATPQPGSIAIETTPDALDHAA